MLTKISRGIS